MEKTGKKIKRIIILIILLLIVGAAVWFIRKAIVGATEMAVLRSDTCGYAKRQDLTNYASMSGKISSSDKLIITADPALKVSKLNVKVGDSVKKGDVLCEFDSSKLQEEYDRMSLNNDKAQGASQYSHNKIVRNLDKAKQQKNELISQAQSAIDSAVKKRDNAYNEYNKKVEEYNELLGKVDEAYNELSASSIEDYITTKAAYDKLQAQLNAAESALSLMHESLSSYDDAVSSANEAYSQAVKSGDEIVQAAQEAIDAEQYSITDDSYDKQLEELKERIDRCIIKAERDGVVTELNISEGSVPDSSNIMTIENTSQLIVAGRVGEADILKISEGMEAEIKTSATEERIIKGSVKRIERIISSGSNKVDMGGYTVEISIDEEDSGLLIGMSANVKIILDKRTDVLSVPYDAIAGGENEGYYVYVASPAENGNYRLSKHDVTVGFEGVFYTEIISSDIKEGDIVLTDPHGVSEGEVIPLSVPEE